MENSKQNFSNIIPSDRPHCEFYVLHKLADIRKQYELQKGKQKEWTCIRGQINSFHLFLLQLGKQWLLPVLCTPLLLDKMAVSVQTRFSPSCVHHLLFLTKFRRITPVLSQRPLHGGLATILSTISCWRASLILGQRDTGKQAVREPVAYTFSLLCVSTVNTNSLSCSTLFSSPLHSASGWGPVSRLSHLKNVCVHLAL